MEVKDDWDTWDTVEVSDDYEPPKPAQVTPEVMNWILMHGSQKARHAVEDGLIRVKSADNPEGITMTPEDRPILNREARRLQKRELKRRLKREA